MKFVRLIKGIYTRLKCTSCCNNMVVYDPTMHAHKHTHLPHQYTCSGLVMYWKKKKPSQSAESEASSIKFQPPQDNIDGSLASCYEMPNMKPPPSALCTAAAKMKSTALNGGKIEDGPVYELTDAVNCYAELS